MAWAVQMWPTLMLGWLGKKILNGLERTYWTWGDKWTNKE
jgi:hypothetical protein